MLIKNLQKVSKKIIKITYHSFTGKSFVRDAVCNFYGDWHWVDNNKFINRNTVLNNFIEENKRDYKVNKPTREK